MQPKKPQSNRIIEKEQPESRWMESLFGGMSLAMLEAFCKRFATGLHSGLDILRLLKLEAKYGSARHKGVLQSMVTHIEGGESLASSMSKQGKYFPLLLVRMVGAGEHAGRQEHTFLVMSDHYAELRKARGNFLAQITFPLISLAIAFGTISILIFVNGFMQAGSALDKPLDLSGVGLRGFPGVLIFWFICALACVAIGVAILAVWKNWFGSHRVLFPLARNLPVVGPVLTNTALSRVSMTLAMMLGAGVNAKRSVREAILSTGNQFYMDGVRSAEKEIEQGHSFAEAFRAPGTFPEEFLQVIEVGEMSGSESESLERLSDTYRDKANHALHQLAVFAGLAVWLMIAVVIIIAIFTIFAQILEVYTNAGKI